MQRCSLHRETVRQKIGPSVLTQKTHRWGTWIRIQEFFAYLCDDLQRLLYAVRLCRSVKLINVFELGSCAGCPFENFLVSFSLFDKLLCLVGRSSAEVPADKRKVSFCCNAHQFQGVQNTCTCRIRLWRLFPHPTVSSGWGEQNPKEKNEKRCQQSNTNKKTARDRKDCL